ncbi:putative protein, mitochondrial [Sesamum angolense]|uniref:Mitochondrial glycoprotein n=1 Tax=Sesamum angolense TaxID=2727404 RepID=A0AAE1X0Y9_9LAMI|nr:putative protein, mitochondrial [Sesamum angolense]
MALNNAIRRAASRVVPLAIRPAAGSQRYLHNHRTSALFAAINSPTPNVLQRSLPLFFHHYSTKPSSDEALLRVIDSEIECAVESQDEEEQTITLTREYQGETITVEVHMPDLVTGEENDHDDDDDDDEQEERGNQSSIPLVVRVSKKSGPSLEFGCTAYPDEVAIDSLAVKDPNNSEDQIAYEGPDFADLDENLQKAFHKYLELRGIKRVQRIFCMGTWLTNSREYTTWLKNLQKVCSGVSIRDW